MDPAMHTGEHHAVVRDIRAAARAATANRRAHRARRAAPMLTTIVGATVFVSGLFLLVVGAWMWIEALR